VGGGDVNEPEWLQRVEIQDRLIEIQNQRIALNSRSITICLVLIALLAIVVLWG
jgi:hypothetical protein